MWFPAEICSPSSFVVSKLNNISNCTMNLVLRKLDLDGCAWDFVCVRLRNLLGCLFCFLCIFLSVLWEFLS